jgi:uncharacterized RDD family membrane protein YckC
MKFYTVHTKPYIKLRIIATLIDYGIFGGLLCVFIITMGEDQGNGDYAVNGWPVLLVPIFWTIYFVVTEAVNQATPGHDICKLKVYKINGQKPGFTDAFKRRVCDPLDIFVYGLPALICILKTPKHQRLGDLFADTVVAKASDIEVNEVEF